MVRTSPPAHRRVRGILQGPTVADNFKGKRAAFILAGATLAEKHPAGEFQSQFDEVFRAVKATAQDVDTLDDFQGIADVTAQGLIHVGNQSDHFLPMRSPVSTIKRARNSLSAGSFINAPRAGFDIQDEAVDSFGSFLLMMEAQMRDGLSTVAVTSRNA